MYGREGYFTHAVPAKHTTLYGAKFSWALTVWLVALLIAVGTGLGFFVGQTAVGGGTASDAWTALGQALAGLSAGVKILIAAVNGARTFLPAPGLVAAAGGDDPGLRRLDTEVDQEPHLTEVRLR